MFVRRLLLLHDSAGLNTVSLSCDLLDLNILYSTGLETVLLPLSLADLGGPLSNDSAGLITVSPLCDFQDQRESLPHVSAESDILSISCRHTQPVGSLAVGSLADNSGELESVSTLCWFAKSDGSLQHDSAGF
jgi:hypothetical protein